MNDPSWTDVVQTIVAAGGLALALATLALAVVGIGLTLWTIQGAARELRLATRSLRASSIVSLRDQVLRLNQMIVEDDQKDLGPLVREDRHKAFLDSIMISFETACVLHELDALPRNVWEAELRFMASMWRWPEFQGKYRDRLSLYDESLRRALERDVPARIRDLETADASAASRASTA